MSKHPRQVASHIATTEVSPPSTDDVKIAELAYELWMKRGCPIGSDQEDWFQAEQMLRSPHEVAIEELAASA